MAGLAALLPGLLFVLPYVVDPGPQVGSLAGVVCYEYAVSRRQACRAGARVLLALSLRPFASYVVSWAASSAAAGQPCGPAGASGAAAAAVSQLGSAPAHGALRWPRGHRGPAHP